MVESTAMKPVTPETHQIQFLFDFLSPYAYVAWHGVHAVAAQHGCTVEPVPVLFAALLNANGQKGPAEIPSKRLYVFKDALRAAVLAGLPLVPPPAHPFSPLLALRAAGLPLPPAERRRFLDALWRRAWGGGGGVETSEDLAAAALEAGLDPAMILDAARSDAAKKNLRSSTESALSSGVFGVPTMLVRGELFWGNDSLPHLGRFLFGDDPFSPQNPYSPAVSGHAELQRWRSLPATAHRTPAKAFENP